jgi:acyl-CoA hydrolase
VLDIVPTHYSELSVLFAKGACASDVVLISVDEPNAYGSFNLGLTNDYVLDAARRARCVFHTKLDSDFTPSWTVAA